MRFEIHLSKDKLYYFILKAGNSEVVATSETYKSKQMCRKGIKSVKKCFFAPVVEMFL